MSSAIAAQQLQAQYEQRRNRGSPSTSAEPEQGAFRLRQVVVVVQRQSRMRKHTREIDQLMKEV